MAGVLQGCWRRGARRAGAALLLAGAALLPLPAMRLCAVAQAAADPVPLHFGLISTLSRQELETLWTPLLQELGREIGAPVIPAEASDYAGMIWALREGAVQLAWMGNKSAIEAVDHARGEVFAKTITPSGMAGYYSLLIVRADSPLASASDMMRQAAGLTFGLGDRNSTSGYVVPIYALFGKTARPDQMFRRVLHGNHEDNFLAVADGRADVAVVASTVLDQMKDAHPRQYANVRVIWQSPLIPSDPLVWRKDLPEETKQAIRRFFLNYGQPAHHKSPAALAHEKAILHRLSISSFSLTDDRHLLPVRRMELYSQRLRLQADQDMTGEERARRLAALDTQVAMLDRQISLGTPE